MSEKKQSGEGQASPLFIPAGHYYTVPEVAEMYQLGRRSIIYWLEQGWVKGIKTGIGWLIEADSVKGFLPPKPGPKPETFNSTNELLTMQKGNKSKLITFIYTLIDPLTDDICYVGTTTKPYSRYRLHISEGTVKNMSHTKSPKNMWIKGLLEN